ncbi:NADH-quinone oxidoreductase subunit C, partial [Paenibacillus chitinolyticus]
MTDKEKENPQETDIRSKPTKSDDKLEANTIEYKEKQGILSKEENNELHTSSVSTGSAGDDIAPPAGPSEQSASAAGTGESAPETPASGAAQRPDRTAARSAAAAEAGGTAPATANGAAPTEGAAAEDGGDKAKAAAEARAARA